MIWGLKGEACFDVWSVQHFLSGITVGASLLLLMDRYLGMEEEHTYHNRIYFMWLILLAYLWECLEHYLETGLLGTRVAYWFQGVEFWCNRIIADPMMTVAGGALVKKVRKIKNIACVLVCIWISVHIFVFPHSMYLHDLFSILLD